MILSKKLIFISILLFSSGCMCSLHSKQDSRVRDALDIKRREALAEIQGSPNAAGDNQSNLENADSGKTVPENDQGLLDSAIEFYQTSNEFWEQGDLENALDDLDKAYSLILAVGQDTGQGLQQQKEDLRFTIARRIMEVYASRVHAVNGPQKAIPLVMNKHVERALKSFKTREKKFFIDAYVRSGRYRPEIIKALREEGLPEELSWLPLIESGFKVRAMSRARALGMWQFIASTGYKFGLERNTWIDERMDPEKSTQAAIAYLKELHSIFGDWTTALAAYNCGEGTVLKVIRRQKISYLDNFWDLYKKLPRETASYVPRFMAVLHIINAPEQYGIVLPPPDEEVKLEEVTIDKQVHLKTVAKNIEYSYQDLKNLNPELRKYVTPANPYSLKVPDGKAEILLAKLNDIPIYVPSVPAYAVHRVRNGESLSVIASKYRTSVRAIVAMNNLKSRKFIRAGRKLKIPTGKRTSYRSKRPRTYSTKLKGDLLEYVVKKGDSLWEIANAFKTTTKKIQSLNQLSSTRLAVGQVLLLPKRNAAVHSGETKPYKVKGGDSPFLIARRHKMNLADFLRINGLTPRSMIFPGQEMAVKTN
jgi:membrane-bound lytic murein transglycosylase D